MASDAPRFALSDDLPQILDLFERWAIPNGFITIDLVIDANVVLNDILWIIRKARGKTVRTALLEVMEAGTVKCYAPQFLRTEVEKYIPLLAERYEFDEGLAHEVWTRFHTHITFIDTEEPPDRSELRDPKDWPYIRVQEMVSATIVTDDADIAAMGGRSSPKKIVVSLQGYARESAVELQLKLLGHIGVTIPGVLILGVVKLVSGTVSKFAQKSSNWVYWVSLLLIVALLMYSPSRDWLKAKASTMGGKLAQLLDQILEVIQPAMAEYDRARTEANEHLKNFNKGHMKLKQGKEPSRKG